MGKIDLNCDLGESFGAYVIGRDEEVIRHISSANVACGYHAGDPMVMEKTVRMAKENGVSIGAHPGFPDLMGFGRRNMNISPDEARTYLKYQIGALRAFCDSYDVPLVHVKPHGALYNMAAKDRKLADALAQAVYEVDKNLIFLGLSGSLMLEAAKEKGLRCASEVFADRAYNADGSLVARGTPGAVIHDVDLCVKRIVGMVKDHRVTAITGEEIELSPQSICVHGDNAEAVAFVKHIRETLEAEGIEVTGLGNC